MLAEDNSHVRLYTAAVINYLSKSICIGSSSAILYIIAPLECDYIGIVLLDINADAGFQNLLIIKIETCCYALFKRICSTSVEFNIKFRVFFSS